MKQSLRVIWLTLIISCIVHADSNYVNIPGNVIIKPQPNARGVDNVDCDVTGQDIFEETLSKVCVIAEKTTDLDAHTDTVHSKACDLLSAVENLSVSIDVSDEFGGTFTLIEEATSKACVIEEKTTDLDTISQDAESKLCVVESKVDMINVIMNLSDEFGGTFTALDELESKVCVVEDKTDDLSAETDLSLSKVCIVESKLNTLDVSMSFSDEFGGTYTALEELNSKICVIDENTQTILSVDQESVSKMCAVESYLGVLDISETVSQEFTQVYTELEADLSKACVIETKEDYLGEVDADNLSKLCVIESKLNALDESTTVTEEFAGTFTLLEEAISKICVVEDDVDIVTDVVNNQQSKLDIIFSQLDNLFVTVDLSQEFGGTFTLIQEALSKLCVVEDQVDTLDNSSQEIHSKLCVVESKVDAFDISDDIASEFDGTYTILDESLSKLCVIEDNLEIAISDLEVISTEDFGGTFTALEELKSKVCVIDENVEDLSISVVDGINEQLSIIEEITLDVIEITETIVSACDSILYNLSKVDATVEMTTEKSCAIESKLCVVDEKIDEQISLIDVIRTEDFGGTFTALEEAMSKACIVDDKTIILDDSADLVQSKLCEIEDSLNVAGNATEDFTGIYTVIEAQISKECLIEDVIDNTTDTTDITLSKLCDLNSSLDALNVSIDVSDEFGGTYTALEEAISKVCVVDNKVIQEIEDATNTESKACIVDAQLDEVTYSSLDLAIEFEGTFTLIDEATSKLCVIEDKEQAVIDTAYESESKLCVIESKIDALDVSDEFTDEFASLFEHIDENVSKACVVDEKVDGLNQTAQTSESKACVVESRIDAIDVSDDLSYEFGGTYTLIDTAISKACVVETTVDDITETTSVNMSKACVIASKIEALDVSDSIAEEFNATLTFIEAIESKVCLGLCEPIFIAQADVPYTITEGGTYIVTENLTLSGVDAIITVSANDVVVDLCNMVLTGQDGATGIAVYKDGVTTDRTNITIKNGALRGDTTYYMAGMDIGIFLDDEVHNVRIEHIDISHIDTAAIQVGTVTAAIPPAYPAAGSLRTPLSQVFIHDVNIIDTADGIVVHRLASHIYLDTVLVTQATQIALSLIGVSGFEIREVHVNNCRFVDCVSQALALISYEYVYAATIRNSIVNNNTFYSNDVAVLVFNNCRKILVEDSDFLCNVADLDYYTLNLDVIRIDATQDAVLRRLHIKGNTATDEVYGIHSQSNSKKIAIEDCAVVSNTAANLAVGVGFEETDSSIIKHTKCLKNGAASTVMSRGFSFVDCACNTILDSIANGQQGAYGAIGYYIDRVTNHQWIRCVALSNGSDGFSFVDNAYYAAAAYSECKDCQAMYNGRYGFDLTGADDTVLLIRNIACGNGV